MDVDGRKFTIGRDKQCDVPIADDSVSRLHAELTLNAGGALMLTDCGSSNGTVLIRQGTAKAIRATALLPTDRVRFGGFEISARDILDALARKYPEVKRGFDVREADSADWPRRGAGQSDAGRKEDLVRCECGSVKSRGETCKTCGF